MADESLTLEETAAIADAMASHLQRDQQRQARMQQRARDRAAWRALERAALPPFVASAEASARGLVFGPGGLDALLAFPLHVEAATRWFAARGAAGPHALVDA